MQAKAGENCLLRVSFDVLEQVFFVAVQALDFD